MKNKNQIRSAKTAKDIRPAKASHLSGEPLIRIDNVSKRFCKSLKRSLWYAVCDMASELNPFNGSRPGSPDGTLNANLSLNSLIDSDSNLPEASGFRRPPLRKNEFWALEDVSLEVRRGECLGLIGHNGAGKSTLLKMMCGLVKPDAGQIEVRGRVGALLELGAGFNPILTGRENIYNRGAVLGLSKHEVDLRFGEITAFSGIEDFLDMPVQNLSSGMKVRLGFAVSVFVKPDVLLIDEVLAVGDLGFVIKCLNKMAEIMQGSAVIFVSHNMPMVARICTSVCLLDHGHIEYMGSDVPNGIEHYVNKFENNGREEQGDGLVRLTDISVRSHPSQEFISDHSFILANGDPLEFRLEFAVDGRIDSPFEIFVKIIDQQLREVIDCISSETGDLFLTRNGKVRCLVRMDRVYLNRGKHSVTIGVTDPHTEAFHCRATNTIFFCVRTKVQGWASSVVPGKWSTIS